MYTITIIYNMRNFVSLNIEKFTSSNLKEICFYQHGGLISYYQKKYPQKKIIDFSVNLNPMGDPFKNKLLNYKSIINKTLKYISQYPDVYYNELKSCICKYMNIKNISKENIIVGNGSTEIINLFCSCYLKSIDTVIIINPTFSEYEHFCKIQGAKIIYINEKDILNISIDLLKLSKIVFLCNPNNPTGYYYKKESLINFIKKCLYFETIVFIDEAFMELTKY